MRTFWILTLMLALAPGAPARDAPVTFDLRGDRLSVNVRNATVLEILELFAMMGVDARLDPGVDARVTASFKNKDLERALDILFDDVNYSARWQSIPGPLGDLERLAEIRVFRQGQRNNARAVTSDKAGRLSKGKQGSADGYLAGELLLRLKPGTSLEDAQRLLRKIGGHVIESIPAMGIYRIRLSGEQDIPALVKKLTSDSRVAAAEPNYAFPIPESTFDPNAPIPPLDELADTALPPDGAIAVAVLDTGLEPVQGLEDLVVASYDMTTMSTNMTDPVGHGTQMALIAAGVVWPTGVAENGLQGVPIVAIRAFGDDGTTSNFDLMRSVGIAVQNGARVLNMSWYTTGDSEFLKEVIAYAESEDVVMVAAAGNDPTGKPVYPAGLNGVIAVAAANPDGSIWELSNYGDFVDLTAPGSAELPVGYNGNPGHYAGTSIASAYTAGILSRYLTQNPEATAEQALEALLEALTADSDQLSQNKHGGGLLDSDAVERLLGTETTP